MWCVSNGVSLENLCGHDKLVWSRSARVVQISLCGQDQLVRSGSASVVLSCSVDVYRHIPPVNSLNG